MTECNNNHKQIRVFGKCWMNIDVAHIVCCEADEECTFICLLGKEKQRVTGCLKSILALIGEPYIIRVHKSWAANLNFLVEIDLSTGKRIMKFIDEKEAEMSARIFKKFVAKLKELDYLPVFDIEYTPKKDKTTTDSKKCKKKKNRKE